MSFPSSPRVIYKKNPLEEVICQLKFPSILKIDAELPAKFQDALRADYPLFQEVSPIFPNLVAGGLPVDLSKLMKLEIPISLAAKLYQFTSADEKWKVSLAKESVALSTGAYLRWEEFRVRLEHVVRSLVAQYSPAFFLRIGLRYRDVVRRSVLGLEEVCWSDLLKPHLLGELASKDVESEVLQSNRDTLISTDSGRAKVHIRHGLARVPGSNEEVYFVDSDFYDDKRTEVSDVDARLESLHREAGHLFRWYITDRLHGALEPQPI